MKFWSILIFLLTILVWKNFASDTFSSIAELEQLYLTERDVTAKLQLYVNGVKKQLDAFESYLKEYSQVAEANIEPGRFIGNPINAFHLMRRLTILWNEVKNALQAQTVLTNIVKEVVNTTRQFPTMDDFSGAAFSFAQLQGAYKLNTSQLARGYVQLPDQPLFSSVHGLNARDCLFIGKHAFNKGLYDQAVQWLETAIEIAHSEGNTTATVKEIEPFLNTALRIHDDVLEKKGPLGKDWHTNPEPLNANRLEKFRKKQKKKSHDTSDTMDALGLPSKGTPDFQELEIFFKLCRGERIRPAYMDKDLKCRLLTYTHPYFILRPLRHEQVSLNPYIALFHDFMSSNEMDVFKNLTLPRLQRSQHGGRMGYMQSDKRTSKQTWVPDEAHPTVRKITKRISDAVGLNAYPENMASEHFQVANYGIGGRYTPHTDHGLLMMPRPGEPTPSEEEFYRGDRIATFMTYLGDVEAGGGTAFTYAGASVKAKKGDAVFWWNLFSDLQGDDLSRHGGCPVLHGSKWICNKWFHSHDQVFRQPCALKPKTRIAYP